MMLPLLEDIRVAKLLEERAAALSKKFRCIIMQRKGRLREVFYILIQRCNGNADEVLVQDDEEDR